MTVRLHLALDDLSVPQTSLVHSRNPSCIAAPIQDQLLRKAVAQLGTTHTIRPGSVVTQNRPILVLLLDQRTLLSVILILLHQKSQTSLSGEMPSTLSQLLKNWALPATFPLRARQTCLVTII